ncbi:MAG: prephenate dehydrogenase/arogenate dehydrogenase family protein [Pseudomonadota bacterium]
MTQSTLVIIGLGLIGGSLAAGLKQFGAGKAGYHIIGLDHCQQSLDIAIAKGIIDRGVLSLDDIAQDLSSGDMVIIAVPTLSVPKVIHALQALVDSQVTITDAASVKGNVVEAVIEAYGELPPQFVPGHPIAGSEKSGVAAGHADLFVNHRVILTPSAASSSEHVQRVSTLWQAVGAEVVFMPVSEHDAVLAATSHLPHAIAYSLVDTLANDADNENIFRYAAGGFRDFTRIASSDPQMWHDIMLANRAAVLQAITLFQNNLSQLRTAIDAQDSAALLKIFSRAKSVRDEFSQLIDKQLTK